READPGPRRATRHAGRGPGGTDRPAPRPGATVVGTSTTARSRPPGTSRTGNCAHAGRRSPQGASGTVAEARRRIGLAGQSHRRAGRWGNREGSRTRTVARTGGAGAEEGGRTF